MHTKLQNYFLIASLEVIVKQNDQSPNLVWKIIEKNC